MPAPARSISRSRYVRALSDLRLVEACLAAGEDALAAEAADRGLAWLGRADCTAASAKRLVRLFEAAGRAALRGAIRRLAREGMPVRAGTRAA